MKQVGFGVVWVIAVTVAAVAQQSAPAVKSSKLDQGLIQSVQQLAQAQKRHDDAYLARVLADDFLEIAGNGRLYNKREVLEGFKDVDLQEIALDSFKVLPLGRDIGSVTYVAHVKVLYAGAPLPANDYLNSTWVRRQGQWRLVFHQSTPIQENHRKEGATCSIF